jgi:hypothetical protein
LKGKTLVCYWRVCCVLTFLREDYFWSLSHEADTIVHHALRPHRPAHRGRLSLCAALSAGTPLRQNISEHSGAYIFVTTVADADLRNSILAGNGESTQPNCAGSIMNAAYNWFDSPPACALYHESQQNLVAPLLTLADLGF